MSRNKLKQGDWGWIGLVGGITAYELLCDNEQTLSERVDVYMQSRLGKVACYAATTITALHLLNHLDPKIDPFNYALRWKQKTLDI